MQCGHQLKKMRSEWQTLAASMQLPLVTFHAGFIPEEACVERTTMLARLQTLVNIFGRSGIQLGLETGQECAENVVSVLEELSHEPQLGVNLRSREHDFVWEG